MKRDFNLIRQILLRIEEDEGSSYVEMDFEGYSEDLVQYHLEMLLNHGFITGHEASGIFPTGLTWEGHEFLDAARNEGVWTEAKERIKPLGSVPLEILKTLLVEVAKKQVGL